MMKPLCGSGRGVVSYQLLAYWLTGLLAADNFFQVPVLLIGIRLIECAQILYSVAIAVKEFAYYCAGAAVGGFKLPLEEVRFVLVFSYVREVPDVDALRRIDRVVHHDAPCVV